MSEENEKYPQIVIGTDRICQIFIKKDVELKFDSAEAIEEFFQQHQEIHIVGKKDNRMNQLNDGAFAKQILWRLTK